MIAVCLFDMCGSRSARSCDCIRAIARIICGPRGLADRRPVNRGFTASDKHNSDNRNATTTTTCKRETGRRDGYQKNEGRIRVTDPLQINVQKSTMKERAKRSFLIGFRNKLEFPMNEGNSK
jgi:hypothetical protein